MKMSGEASFTNAVSFQHQSNTSSVGQIDYMKLLNNLFQHDINTPSKTVDAIFEQFEKTFQSKDKDKQQIALVTNIIGQLFDFYVVNGISNSISLADGKNKTIIDLFCLLPEDFCNKFFDKISDFIHKIPQTNIQQTHSLLSSYTSLTNPLMNSSNLANSQNASASNVSGSNVNSQASSITNSNNSVKQFEKCTNLILLVCYRKKNWLNKLLNHGLLANLIRMLKVHTNLNNLILVHISLLFVLLMNKIPAQILNAHLENIFLIFTYLYKYLITVDNQKLLSDEGTIGRSVKWAIRLYFYVCYGLYANQFVQFLRKKDQQSLNKEFLTSIFFYLRLHPAIFKEKMDSDKQFKYLTDTDASIEWRQYCLDPLCTNYNQTIQKIFKQGSSLNLSELSLNQTVTYNIASNPPSQTRGSGVVYPIIPPTLASLSKLTHESQSNFSSSLSNSQILMTVDQTPLSNLMPLSPSYLFANTNRNSSLENSSNKPAYNSNISLFQQPSLPTTPVVPHVFQYPPLASEFSTPTQMKFDFNAKKHHQLHQTLGNQQNISKQPIKNLTAHFMMNDIPNSDLLNSSLSSDYSGLFNGKKTNFSIKKSFFYKQKSKSETNLCFEIGSEKKAHTLVSKSIPAQNLRETQNQGSTIIMPEISNEINDENNTSHNKISIKSETRDSSIKDPFLLGKLSNRNSSNINQPNTTDSSTNTYENDSCSLSQTSVSLLTSNFSKLNSIEANDPLYGYFSNLNHEDNSPDNNSTIKKLRHEVNHLVLQLIYERHLRDKYEEDSNRLHFCKIERDQLLVEKSYLEKNLKQLVEEYKNEIEMCLNEQNKVELNAYKKEMDEKDILIGSLHSKLTEYEEQILDWSQKYQNIRVQNEKIKLTYGTAIQSFESELNSRTKNEIDTTYIKSLRYSNETLRKKLLLLNKSHQTLLNTFNQGTMSQLKDVIEIYNNPVLLAQFLSSKKDQDHIENGNPSRGSKSNTSGSISSILLNPLLEFQQDTIHKLQNEIDSYKSSFDKLLIQNNEMGIKLEQLKKSLELEQTKSNELDQSLDMEVVNKAELIKNHVRIESSLINVNKRLEEEIVKLKANLKEQVLTNSKLLKQNESLKANKYESIRMFLTQSNLTEQSESQDNGNGDHNNQ